ncbi:hypothetical protein [Bacillus sp. EB600]|uniref:hypothetical protein n=1 Tax=Bacillus sp. EB600 TaxID=2806345 RepID=UPI00210B7D06|nr:hypothetical protein [Bacillus sp. EB600]
MRCPTHINVPFTLKRFKTSRTAGVQTSSGPSSNVSDTTLRFVGPCKFHSETWKPNQHVVYAEVFPLIVRVHAGMERVVLQNLVRFLKVFCLDDLLHFETVLGRRK